MDIRATVTKFIESVGVDKAAKLMGVNKQTVQKRLKSPDTITIREFDAVMKAMPALKPQPEPARPVQAPEEPSYGGEIEFAQPEAFTEENLPQMPFRPGDPPPQMGLMDTIILRIERIEQFIQALAGPYGNGYGDQVQQAARKLLPELSSTMTGRSFRGAEHPLHQVHMQPRQPQVRRPAIPAADMNWNTPR